MILQRSGVFTYAAQPITLRELKFLAVLRSQGTWTGVQTRMKRLRGCLALSVLSQANTPYPPIQNQPQANQNPAFQTPPPSYTPPTPKIIPTLKSTATPRKYTAWPHGHQHTWLETKPVP